MTVDASIAPSGLPDVDRQWGGFASGHTYLLVGRAGAGRAALAFQTVRASVDAGTKCLVLSPRPPEALVEVARGVGLDLAQAHGAGQLRVLRIPPAAELAKRGADSLEKSYRDLVGLVDADRPGRVVIEDFTPLIQFDTFERFRRAFEQLVGDLRERGATLVIGLGDPANDASRRLVDVVSTLVDGTVRLSASGNVSLDAPADAPSDPDRETTAADTPTDGPLAAPDEAPSAPEPAGPDASMEDAFGLEIEEDFSAPSPPAPPPGPEESTNDGSRYDTDPPRPTAPSESAPTVSLPPAPAAATATASGPPATDIVAPPPADPDLLLPPDDAFGADPADAIVDQGYLADSNGMELPRPAAPPHPPAQAAPVAAPAPPTAPAPGAGGPLPAFAPLGVPAAPAPSPAEIFQTSLDAAFNARDAGTPFLVVALRMEPAQPQAAHFGSVETGLRAASRETDRVLVDAVRKRAIVLLPSSGPEAGQVLFAGLQAHLRAALGAEADAVLGAIGAVTVPNGQPFGSSRELLDYAFAG